MKTETTHINSLKVGDSLLIFGSEVAVITQTLITGKGYQSIYGYYVGEESNPHLLESCDCYLERIVE